MLPHLIRQPAESTFAAAGRTSRRCSLSDDSFGLTRFLDAQAAVYEQARAELARASKQTHWMWFLFPQVAGLGSSPTAQRYAIQSLGEAKTYLEHPVLGARLRDCVSAVNQAHPKPLARIFGYPDDLKFHSSITLFHQVERPETLFADTLQLWFEGRQDDRTLGSLSRRTAP